MGRGNRFELLRSDERRLLPADGDDALRFRIRSFRLRAGLLARDQHRPPRADFRAGIRDCAESDRRRCEDRRGAGRSFRDREMGRAGRGLAFCGASRSLRSSESRHLSNRLAGNARGVVRSSSALGAVLADARRNDRVGGGGGITFKRERAGRTVAALAV